MVNKRKAEEINDYEAQRQANIAKNQALFKELQLDAASAGLAPNSKPARTSNGASRPRSKPKPRASQGPAIPTRSSSRLLGIVADSEVARQKAEDEREHFAQEEKAKRQRMGADIRIEDAVTAGQSWTQSGNWLRDVQPANPYERTFDLEDVKSAGTADLKELRTKMSSLGLWEDYEPSRIKITPERIYSMQFHPTEDKQLVFAGDKMGSLGLFDGSQKIVKHEDDDGDELDEDNSPAITTFKTHTRTISTIHFTKSQPKVVYTSSYDSSIRKLDLEKGISTEVYAPADDDDDEPLSGVSIPITEPNMIYFASLNGMFGIHDIRTDYRGSSTVESMQLSDKKIGGFSVHPLHPHYLATASLDRTLKIWDIRKITGSKGHRHPQLVAEHESRLSVSHAAFNAAGQVATSSYDDTIKIHHLDQCGSWPVGQTLTDEEFKPTTTIRHNNQTGRWVTILKPHWQERPTSVGGGAQRFVIGNMNRFVDVYAGSGEQLAQLGGSNQGITAVPAVTVFHPSLDWIAGGTASGKLCLWL